MIKNMDQVDFDKLKENSKLSELGIMSGKERHTLFNQLKKLSEIYNVQGVIDQYQRTELEQKFNNCPNDMSFNERWIYNF